MSAACVSVTGRTVSCCRTGGGCAPCIPAGPGCRVGTTSPPRRSWPRARSFRPSPTSTLGAPLPAGPPLRSPRRERRRLDGAPMVHRTPAASLHPPARTAPPQVEPEGLSEGAPGELAEGKGSVMPDRFRGIESSGESCARGGPRTAHLLLLKQRILLDTTRHAVNHTHTSSTSTTNAGASMRALACTRCCRSRRLGTKAIREVTAAGKKKRAASAHPRAASVGVTT